MTVREKKIPMAFLKRINKYFYFKKSTIERGGKKV
jgi:hypothetical protein